MFDYLTNKYQFYPKIDGVNFWQFYNDKYESANGENWMAFGVEGFEKFFHDWNEIYRAGMAIDTVGDNLIISGDKKKEFNFVDLELFDGTRSFCTAEADYANEAFRAAGEINPSIHLAPSVRREIYAQIDCAARKSTFGRLCSSHLRAAARNEGVSID